MLGLVGLGVAKELNPWHPEVIVPLGYSTDRGGRLSNATKAGLNYALYYAHEFPKSIVVFANDDICFLGSERRQQEQKLELIRNVRFDGNRVISVGPIQNTVTELMKVKQALEEHGIAPKELLLVTNRYHGASALYIATALWPGVRIALRYSSGKVSQPDHELFFLRHEWTWILSNWIRYAALRILGIERVKKIAQPNR